ncbi:MAG: hypothetical protein WBA45_12480 [Microthrixaceae bacterium]
MSEPDPKVERSRLANAAKERLTADLDHVLGERFTRKGREKVDFYVDGIVVSSFTLFDRPEVDQVERDPYIESAFNARRRIGLIVMRQLTLNASPAAGDRGTTTVSRTGPPGSKREPSTGRSMMAAVESIMESSDGWPLNLRNWVESLDGAGRAAVVATTIAWCEGALRLVGTDPRITWTDPQYSSPLDLPGRRVRLQANIDAAMGTLGTGERLFVVSEALPSPRERITAGFVALVRAIGAGAAPERVTIGAPSRGSMERYEVTEELLELAVDQVIETVARAADIRSLAESGLNSESKSTTESHVLKESQ